MSADSGLQFRWLGPLEVWDGRSFLELGQHKQRALLAVLLIQANQVVSLDRLIDLLWGEEPPASATSALQVYISGLRRLLEPNRAARAPARMLITQSPGYVLKVDPQCCDGHRFEALVDKGRRLLNEGRPAEAHAALTEALNQWRGLPLADFTFEPFAQPEIARLDELRAVTLEDRLEAELAMGQHVHAVAEIERLVGERPLRERLWYLLMLALYRSGRQGEALRAFTRARSVLGEELGIEPGPALRQLEADVLAQSPSLDWTAAVEHGGEGKVPLSRPSPAPAVDRPALVGRHEQLQTLETALAGAQEGRGGVVLVSGEPGIGKTRLVDELAHRAAQRGAIVVWGRCDEGEGAPSFWPWVQIVRALLTEAGPDVVRPALGSAAADLAQLVPEVKELVPGLRPPPPLDPAEARFRLSDALVGLLVRLGRQHDVLVVIDDLHWADDPSLQLVEFAAARLAGTRVVLAVTYRDAVTEPRAALDRALAGLARGPVRARVRLEGLTAGDLHELIETTLGVQPAPEVAAAVWARTDGNPFFAGELARLLAAQNALTGTEGARTVPVPAAVRDVVRLRLARLPDQTNRLLSIASLIGREFDARVVARAASLDDAEALDALDPAVAIGALREDPATFGRFRFCHALVQETIAAELSASRRVTTSARIAEALRILHGDDPASAAEQAHHMFEAAPALGPDPALAAALRAAEVAQAGLAPERAEAQLRRALELVSLMPAGRQRSRKELEVHQRLATLLSMTRGYAAAEVGEEWARALQLCRELGASDDMLSSLWGQCRAARSRARYGTLDELGRELLEIAKTAPGSAFSLAGHEARGVAALYRGDLAAADAHLAEVLELADPPPVGIRGASEISTAVVCRVYLSVLRFMRGNDGDADALSGEAFAVARGTGDHFNEVLALLSSALLASLRGDTAATLAGAEAVLARHERASVGPLAIMAQAWAAWGRSAPAELSHAIADLLDTGWRQNRTWLLGLLADAYRQAGRVEDAVAAVKEALREAEFTGERFYEAELLRLRGELATSPEEAYAYFARAVTTAEAQGAVAFQRRAEAAQSRL